MTTSILLIDEEPVIHEVVTAIFEAQSFEVLSCFDCEQARAHVADRPIDMLLLHRGLPLASCLELIHDAKERGAPALILLSSQRSERCEQDAARLEADAVIYKPIDPAALRQAVAHQLNRRRQERQVPEKPRILVVDDDELVRDSVADTLTDHDYQVNSVESMPAALESMRLHPYEIVLTDIMMTGGSGLELVRHVATNCPQTLAVVMTGYANKDIALNALRHGAHDLLEKPILPDVLLRAMARAWRVLRSELHNRQLLIELKDTNRKLEAAKGLAEAGSRAKSEFLTLMSHEIRTPLNGILGCLSILEQSELNERQQRFTQGARQAGENLLAMLTGVLDFASLEHHQSRAASQEIAPQTFVHNVAEEFRPRIEASGLDLLLEVEESTPAVCFADPALLRQALGLVLDNAQKFSTEGTITLSLEGTPNSLRLAVQDTGHGIASEQLEKIFQPFYQAAPVTTRTEQGAGLGLALCRRLMDTLGGSVHAQSEPGVGSTFVLEWPLKLPS